MLSPGDFIQLDNIHVYLTKNFICSHVSHVYPSKQGKASIIIFQGHILSSVGGQKQTVQYWNQVDTHMEVLISHYSVISDTIA